MNYKIIYIQYTNPASYPPLEHSSRILAQNGWKVLLLGTGSFGVSNYMHFREHVNIKMRKLPYCFPGWTQKFHYIFFCMWVIIWVIRWRPRYVYSSDLLSCPISLVLNYFFNLRIIYHEHDSPTRHAAAENSNSIFYKLTMWTRKKLSRRASLCILPNEQRMKLFGEETGITQKLFCVWNCPGLEEVRPAQPLSPNKELNVYYHGVISKEYLSINILKAIAILPLSVNLNIIGYEPRSSQGYSSYIKEQSRRLKIENHLVIYDSTPTRCELFKICSSCDVGLSIIPKEDQDINNIYKTGASNKPFDYLACGLALLVSDAPDWKKIYVESGYGLACNPHDPESIAEALSWFLKHPAEMRQMGESGRQRVLKEWNYEKQFSPIIELLNKNVGFIGK